MQDILIPLYERDLKKVITELELYLHEENIWKTDIDIKNSAGNLSLHIAGNLNHFIGTILGNTSYVRNREAEFALRDVPRQQLINEIQSTSEVVVRTLSNVQGKILDEVYPVQVFGYEMTTGYFLVHLATHLSYHLGQINYHRRLLDREKTKNLMD